MSSVKDQFKWIYIIGIGPLLGDKKIFSHRKSSIIFGEASKYGILVPVENEVWRSIVG